MSAERNGNGNGRVAIDNDNGTKRDETERNGTQRNETQRNETEANALYRAITERKKPFLLVFNFVSWLSLYFQHFGTSFSLIWLLFCISFFYFIFFCCCLRVCALSLAEIEIETEAFPLLFNAN